MDFYYIRTLHCLTMLRFVWFVVAMNIEQLSNPNQCGLSDSVSSFFNIWLWGERCVKVTDAMLDSPDFHPGAFYKNVYNVFHVKCLCGICLHKQGLFWSMLKVSSVLKAKLGKCDFYVAFSNVFHVKQQTWRSAVGGSALNWKHSCSTRERPISKYPRFWKFELRDPESKTCHPQTW